MRINREIRAERLRVVSESGEQLGVMTLREALMKAEEAGLDLVEIAPMAKPPVAKIIDYGKFRYHQQKKEKDSKKSQIQVKMKEIKLRPNIDEHDLLTKAKQAREFLVKGNKVRLTTMFRGREMVHLDLGRKMIEKFCSSLADVATVEAPSKMLGRTMTTVLAPGAKKPKILMDSEEKKNA
ncbi:MAG: translation initiation factor IF-3 [Verrucomicrobiota bacterium]|nr:translation initiation factor IF-3 [Verrucomicrobiota bacterium]